MRILFFKSSSPHMIDNALRYTDNLTIPRTESPAQIYFFHVSKETSIQSPDIHIISAPDKQRCPRGPENRNYRIILTFVFLHNSHNTPPTKRITVFINKATGCPGIFEIFFLPLASYLRLTSSYLRMLIKISNHWFQPMLRHLDIRIQKNYIFCVDLLQC